ncbi:hypothetical protein SK128_014076 [Halocaridina rubra]|uniref:HAUS augmin-like complex subunit 8 n=1 Tax=Halocaridina rubra TaxID=373956 RepID=A0AAN9AFG7_HALRR
MTNDSVNDNEKTLVMANENTGDTRGTSLTSSGSIRHGNSNNSSEKVKTSQSKVQNKPKSRVVQSRYLGGKSGSRNASGNSKGSSNTNSQSSSFEGSLSSLNITTKKKVPRPGFGKSLTNLNQTSGKIGRSCVNVRTARSGMGSSKNELVAKSKVDSKSGTSGTSKLHSTVLSEKTLLISTDNLFSQTVVGGIGPEGKRLGITKKADTTITALPDLPDISAIRLHSISSDKSENIILQSGSSDNSSSQGCSEIMEEVLADDLEQECLRSLQALYIDVNGDDVFEKQIDELKAQVLFLDQLCHEKQQGVNNQKKMLNLIQQYQNVCEAYTMNKEVICKAVEKFPATESALKVLTEELEKNLHQIRLENLHIPESHKEYREELVAALENQIACLNELQTLVIPKSHQLSATINLLDDLQNNAHRIQQYEREVTQAAALAIQEASLQISVQQSNMKELRSS